ncbi:MAG: hypothetical protein V3V89_04305 [Gammaproteobacteria bacterium]
MSFAEQERALFDLLFDQTLRANFCRDATAALTDYQLDDAERSDFEEIRPHALELDASMRINLVLAHLCRSFPISFSIVSSLKESLELLKQLIDTKTMRTPPIERATVFGTQLREHLAEYSFESANEKNIIIAILEAELGMAWTSAALKRVVIENGTLPANQTTVPQDWSSKPIKLASYVCAAIVPQPYVTLKKALCPCVDTEHWTHLGKHPLAASLRRKTLKQEDPRLLITRAHVSHVSQCEPTVDHKTAELTEGFAPLFQHVNGTASADEILAKFKQAGEPEEMLEGVKAVFKQLVDINMLELAIN